MAVPQFNPSDAISFDLQRGRVLFDGAEQVLVPAGALMNVLREADSDLTVDLGRAIGTEIGRRVVSRFARFGSSVEEAGPDAILDYIGGEFAMLGMGSVGLEVWGKALVFTLEHSPFGAREQGLAASVLEGSLLRAFSRDVELVNLGQQTDRYRFLVANRATALRVRRWLDDGLCCADVLIRMNGEQEGAS